MLCMDADLQHEPESVPKVAQPILNGAGDFAVGSRNVGGGGLGFEWSVLRQIISAGATLLARPLTPSTDPMSGFFCLTKATLARGEGSGISTLGFKIGLELMVRCKCTKVVDVPITFRERVAGESKLTMKQNIEYLRQLKSLYLFKFGYVVCVSIPLLLMLAAVVVAMHLLALLRNAN